MDKLEKAVLEQMNGQRVMQLCPVCNIKTKFICNKDGTAKCISCNSIAEIDLTNVIKGLKEMGVTVK